MKKIFFAIILAMVSTGSWAAAPSRVNTYTSGQVISSSDVTENEDAIFNYLQAGVDTYADGSIVNADVNSSANIQSDKLNLQSIAQAVAITSGGSLTNNGATTLNGALTVTGTTTFSGATISNLGTVTTADINGGTIDGSTIGGSSPGAGTFTTLQANTTFKLGTTNQGDILYDNGTSIVRLTPGTSGQFLKTQGAGANPTWASAATSVYTDRVDTTDQTVNTNGVYTDITGLSVSVTTSVTSNVYVIANVFGYKSTDNNNLQWVLRRDSTTLQSGEVFDTATYTLTDKGSMSSYFAYSDTSLAAGTYAYKLSFTSDENASVTYSSRANIMVIVSPQ